MSIDLQQVCKMSSRILARSTLKYQTELVVKRGCIQQIGPLITPITRRVLVVSSMGGYERSGGYLSFLLQRSGIGVQHYVIRDNYNDFEDESIAGIIGAGNIPSVSAVQGALKIGEHTGCEAVVGVGGGAVQDIARCTAMAMYDKSLLQILQCPPTHMINPCTVMSSTAPYFAVPTNSGSGSELSGSCVMVGADSRRTAVHCDIENSEKLPRRALPHGVLVDLDLSKNVSQPRIAANAVTAYTQCASLRALNSLLHTSSTDDLISSSLDAGMGLAMSALDRLAAGDVSGAQEDVAMASLLAGACQHHDTNTNRCVGGYVGCLSASVQEHLSDLEEGREYTYAEVVVGLSAPLLTTLSECSGELEHGEIAKLSEHIDSLIGAEKATLRAPEDGMFNAIIGSIQDDTLTRMELDLPESVFSHLRETVVTDDKMDQLLRTIQI